SVKGLPLIYSPAWSPDQRYIVFTGFDYKTTDLYRYELSTGQVERMTKDQPSESWSAYAQDQKTLYYLSEAEGQTRLMAVALNERGLPEGEPATIGNDLGMVTSFHLTPE